MKVSALFLITMLVLGINVGATSTNHGVSENPPADIEAENTEDGISTQGLSKPTETHNLKNGKMTFAGTAQASDLYTNKNFTGASSVSIEVHNFKAENLTYKLYKKGKVFAVETFVLKPNQSQVSVRSLDSTGKYYIKFMGPSNFSGSVKAN